MKYKKLVSQIEVLTKKAESARKAEISGVVGKIKAMMVEYSITLADLRDAKPVVKGKKAAAKKAGKGISVAPKYKNPDNNDTWTGRGRQPVWVRDYVASGGTLDSLLIKTD